MICELFKGKERERKRGQFSVLDVSHVSICPVFNGIVKQVTLKPRVVLWKSDGERNVYLSKM